MEECREFKEMAERPNIQMAARLCYCNVDDVCSLWLGRISLGLTYLGEVAPTCVKKGLADPHWRQSSLSNRPPYIAREPCRQMGGLEDGTCLLHSATTVNSFFYTGTYYPSGDVSIIQLLTNITSRLLPGWNRE